ncbi:type VI secretion system Vgr family protein [Janthinobacterium agaricidamnosum]|uniref:Rhs element Vgr family protein n=1 Tax=Janthinobacterium agaricidamnosum NBRC 102515 = DSM 9628 TaxID=1349767 RepID=W0V6D6_9BURK|nr:type VI secretion system Vgr family protein [Janthinobacterium agaricidamnosum]CDG82913.1 rhs element Vgr family protein [Janthinobacterium agaricidamnosum NBRC 102515 = DSM 9628]
MSAVLSSLQELSGSRQHQRILRLSFPNDDGPDAVLLANRLEADEGLSRDFEFVVEVLADNAAIPLKALQGKMVAIELVRGDGSLRYFNGIVFEFSLVKTDGGLVFYSMVLRPWLAYLALRKNNRLFHGRSLRQQAADIFGDYGTLADWDFKVSGDEALTMVTQFDESDHNFLSRRWEAAGLFYHYEHGASGHRLVVGDDSGAAAAIDGASPVIRFQRHGGAREEEAIGEWMAARRLLASQIGLSSFNFKQPMPLHANSRSINQQGDVLPVESYEYTGAHGIKSRQDGEDQARRRMEEIEVDGKHYAARGNNRFSMPGRWFRLTDHFNGADETSGQPDGDDEFLIVSVHHSVSNNYLQNAELPASYDNRLLCLRKSIPWRPGRGFNSQRTKILAPQTATVVTPQGENILVDAFGRIKVQFHWDRIGQNDEKSSAWVRVASAWAGAELGWNAIPRHGMEVVVQWLDGEPDHPLVTGCVYNQQNMPPWKLPGQQTLTGLRSRELSPDHGNAPGGRGNALVLDDTNGKIQAQLKSDHQHSQLSLGHIARIDDTTGRKDERGQGFALETGGAGALRAAKGLLLSTDGRARAQGGVLSRDELLSCLEQALDIARGLGKAASSQQGGKRETGAQQGLFEAVASLGHGVGNEADASGPAAAGQAVIALSAVAGIASATPKDQTHYAGHNIDTVAGKNQQHYAMGDILHTAANNIEQFAVDGDVRLIAHKGKLIQQAQHNSMELTADKSLTLTSVNDGILIRAEKYLLLQVGSSFLRMTPDQITIDAKTLNLQSDAPSISPARGAATEMPTFEVGDAQRKFVAHFDGDQSARAADYHYKIKLKDGKVIEGITDADGQTELAQTDAIHIAELSFWKPAT